MNNPSFTSVLVANRGVIARRIMRTCKELGLKTIGIYTAQDGSAQFNTYADQLIEIPDQAEHSGYMNTEAIVQAAKTLSAAIHPGYGFLSEEPDFREACDQASVPFIGPSQKVLTLAGDKIACQQLVATAGIPTIPSYCYAENAEPNLQEITQLGFPLLLKPAHGGGGIGMRRIQEGEFLPSILEQTRQQAKHLFGNGTLLVEKYLPHAKHIEVQIIADSHGQIEHLFERECSLQRRQQKVIEESPAPSLTQAQREEVYTLALKIAQLIQLDQMATIEFLFYQGQFYFLEINPRLQVEHGVTEMLTGLDLVEWQIKIAQGESIQELGLKKMTGHCIEARIYAEDPVSHLPFPGRVDILNIPDGLGLRIESALWTGLEISPYFDPLLMKIIAHSPDRERTRLKLLMALHNLSINGSLKVNTQALIQSLQAEKFIDGTYDTSTFETLNMEQDKPDWHQDLLKELLQEIQQQSSFESPPVQVTTSFWRPSFWKNLP